MTGTRMTVGIDEAARLRPHHFVSAAGEPVAWLTVGADGEVSVYGSPDAIRRLASALVVCAEEADRLTGGPFDQRAAA
jgi:hypothetical protein